MEKLDGTAAYFVRKSGACSCEDALRHAGQWKCKHALMTEDWLHPEETAAVEVGEFERLARRAAILKRRAIDFPDE